MKQKTHHPDSSRQELESLTKEIQIFKDKNDFFVVIYQFEGKRGPVENGTTNVQSVSGKTYQEAIATCCAQQGGKKEEWGLHLVGYQLERISEVEAEVLRRQKIGQMEYLKEHLLGKERSGIEYSAERIFQILARLNLSNHQKGSTPKKKQSF